MIPKDLAVFDLTRPTHWARGVIFCSPHSGRDYPDWFLDESQMNQHELRSSEDAFVDRLIAPAVGFGAVTLAARIPRALVDLNRAAHELDPVAITGVTRRPINPRIHAGLGVIPRVVARGRAIRTAPIPMTEARRRIDLYWRPYHLVLRQLVAEAVTRFGGALIIDTHSMPHDSVSHLTPPRPHIILGDRHGTSAVPGITTAIGTIMQKHGLLWRRNAPFSGAYIATAYGQPKQNVHVLQIEIDRALYMDESQIVPHDGFAGFADQFAGIIGDISRLHPTNHGIDYAAE